MTKRKRGRPRVDNKRVPITATVSAETKQTMEDLKEEEKISFGKQIDRYLKSWKMQNTSQQ